MEDAAAMLTPPAEELTKAELDTIVATLSDVDALADLLAGAELNALEELQLTYGASSLLNLKHDLDAADEAFASSQNRLAAAGRTLEAGIVAATMASHEMDEGGSSKRGAEDDEDEQGSSKRTATEDTAPSAEEEAIRPSDIEEARRLVEEEARAGLEALASQYASSSDNEEPDPMRMRDS